MVTHINNVTSTQPGKPRNGAGDTVGASQTKQDSTTTSQQAVAHSNSASSDTVQLSAQALELSRIQQDLKSLPEVDESRVAEIRERIASGQYAIDTDQIAAKILVNDQGFNI